MLTTKSSSQIMSSRGTLELAASYGKGVVEPEPAVNANDPAKVESATATTTEVTTGEAPAPSTVVQTAAAAQDSGPPWGLLAVGALAAYLLLKK